MLEHVGDLGLAKTDILHTAESLFHDHVPARRHGLVIRPPHAPPAASPPPDSTSRPIRM